jgi:phosphoglycerate kinase
MVGKVWTQVQNGAVQKVIWTLKQLWNGPLGVFEMENFAHGTIGNFIAESTANRTYW